MTKVADGFFTCVIRHKDRYYCENINTTTICEYEINANNLKLGHSFSLKNAKKDYVITLCISNDLLYVFFAGDNRLDLYSLSGELQSSIGSGELQSNIGSGDLQSRVQMTALGQLNYPIICDVDAMGTILIADIGRSTWLMLK